MREGEGSEEGEKESHYLVLLKLLQRVKREGGDMEAVAALVAVDERTLSFTD